MPDKNRVFIFDTTLRDGEQSPGATMTREEKIRMARQLETLGVDVIEAGFPAASVGDFESVAAIATTVTKPVVAALCRALPSDIDRGYEAIKDAKRKRIHTFLATSPLHMEHKLGKTPEQVLQMAVAAVRHAAAKGDAEVQFSAEDASRSERDFLAKVCTEVIAAGATIINIPDTVGYAQPGEFADLIRFLLSTVPGADKVTFAVHCHNDLGLGVANTLAALEAGARQAEVTLSGIGERAGNASLEQVVMALNTRPNYYHLDTGIVTEEIFPSCRRLSGIIGQPIPPYAPVIGRNAFAHESGIHQHGVLKDRRTYEIMTAESIGRKGAVVVLGKHSGRHALDAKVKELNYTLNDDELKIVFDAVKELADRKQNILDEDIEALILEKILRRPDHFALRHISVHCGNVELAPMAVVQMLVNGKEVRQYSSGSGPVDAAFNAVCAAVGRKPDLEEFHINAITGGTDAQGEVTVRVREGAATSVGRGVHDDVIMASTLAFINALNRLAKKE
ncbi:2-isopropylmalate synthase [Solidesulfovibrio fructosivorans JJ]]|uniref:2-isopropylmalate synthase n=1 Tax=Solidesulfovibrio fructosivorans JJ] TaxID=596151 RepID=E1K278_SOLFR|nr:2-isopropylmalate synthase [Solidesulfovibrio fructosivorans]EFL49297.1 2-isopropylmalate synthase [Solidesulfovibrio fructosivorans JJ]]